MVTTEFATINLKDGITPEVLETSEVHLKGIKTVLSQPGSYRLLWGTALEDPKKLYWLIEWENYEAHAAFMKSASHPESLPPSSSTNPNQCPPKPQEIYPSFGAELLTLADPAHPSGPVEMYHYDFQSPLSTLLTPTRHTVEFFNFKLKPDLDPAAVKTTLDGFLENCKAANVGGLYAISREDEATVLAPIVWESKEEHMRFRERPGFTETITPVRTLIGSAVVTHSALKVVEAEK
ncbi:hypothetical protein ABW19_dt0203951 [Dactylella cylindrospora]|nr:hypothetical protein ABW19_dt0203951 [Dactylella cylindrospora]